MKTKIRNNLIDIEKKVFDIKNEPMPPGAWWWWFWLFFFNNPKNPDKPMQLMLLWSTKNAKEIHCNDIKFKLNLPLNKNNLRGVVAAWYFDGEKMHDNFLFEQCNIKISDKMLSSDSTIPTSFSINKNKNIIKIGKDFELTAELENGHEFTSPTYHSNTYIGNKGYSMIRLIRLKLTGKIKNEKIHGSAFFHRIFVNAPSPSWHWGIFHFEKGGILTYFNPYLFGKSLKKDITFFDGNKVHEFNDINVKLLMKGMPVFAISGESMNEKINFIVNTYSNYSWILKKKTLGIIPNKLIYKEYPAVISDFKLTNKRTGENIVLENLGKSVGNVEHTTGFLF
jgi:hypothetical protein